MKKGTIITLLISFLLAVSTTSGVDGENDMVLDIFGSPVEANTKYFAQTEVVGGSFISRFKVPLVPEFYSYCPESAVFSSSSSYLIHSIPIMFLLSSDVVRVSTELNIKFANPSTCNETGFWQVDDNIFSTFTIKKSDEKMYKFAFGSNADPDDNSTYIILVKELGHSDLWRLKLRRPLDIGYGELKVSFVKYPS